MKANIKGELQVKLVFEVDSEKNEKSISNFEKPLGTEMNQLHF